MVSPTGARVRDSRRHAVSALLISRRSVPVLRISRGVARWRPMRMKTQQRGGGASLKAALIKAASAAAPLQIVAPAKQRRPYRRYCARAPSARLGRASGETLRTPQSRNFDARWGICRCTNTARAAATQLTARPTASAPRNALSAEIVVRRSNQYKTEGCQPAKQKGANAPWYAWASRKARPRSKTSQPLVGRRRRDQGRALPIEEPGRLGLRQNFGI